MLPFCYLGRYEYQYKYLGHISMKLVLPENGGGDLNRVNKIKRPRLAGGKNFETPSYRAPPGGISRGYRHQYEYTVR